MSLTILAEPEDLSLRSLIADQLGVTTEEIAPDVSLIDDLGADSLDMAEVAIAIEDEFAIVISGDTMADVRTYGDLRDAVEAIVNPGARAAVR